MKSRIKTALAALGLAGLFSVLYACGSSSSTSSSVQFPSAISTNLKQ